jgi:ferredoxin
MNPLELTIDSRDITVPSGCTVLEAAEQLKVRIPTLCHSGRGERFTSCMICVVQEIRTGHLLPACSAPVSEGMRIETNNSAVREARKDALDFLLSEHVGDCEAPCRRACPAEMDIPLMIRQLKNGKPEDSIRTVKRDIAIPAVLGRICPAPCEKGCHRRVHDEPVSICLLKRYAADTDLARKSPYRASIKAPSGKKAAVVGAGPAGLSAAYYLIQDGHECHVYDRNPDPGGMLRYGVPREILPESVLDAEIERISELGVEFRQNRLLGGDLPWQELQNEYDAVILAVGETGPQELAVTGIDFSSRGIAVDRNTFESSIPGVFSAGNALSPARMAVRAAGHGKKAAYAVSRFLATGVASGPARRFHSTMGKPSSDEAAELLKEAESIGRIDPGASSSGGFTDSEAGRESSRCFGCDCREKESCRLRLFADEYGADQRRFTFVEKQKFRKDIRHDTIVFESGKCIKCGLCVEIAGKAGEELGLTFVGRGFDVRVEVPLGETLDRGLVEAADKCVEACPTAALSRHKRNGS